MSRATRLCLRVLVACGVAAAALVFVVPLPAATPSSLCASLKAWAEQEYRGASPTLDELAAFDRQHRLAIFTAVTPEVRATLWTEQLRRAASRADLTAEQHAIVTEAQAMVTPAMYREPKREMSAAMRQFSARIQAAFTSYEQRRLLFDIGAAAGAPRAEPRKPSVWERVSRSFGRSTTTRWCECNTETAFWDCMGGASCVDGQCDGFQGCGPFALYYCDRVCDW